MIDPYNPFDGTVWDPSNPEQAIEDPFHGPSAVQELLKVPAMPFGDGTYYQPGGSYVFGTNYVDSRDLPIGDIRIMSSGDAGLGGHELREWLEAYRAGEEELTTLEAKRQQQRLEETGFAHSFKSSDVCAGGKRVEDCDTARDAMKAATEWSGENSAPREGEGVVWNILSKLGGKCGECALSCEVAVKTVDGQAQETRFTNYRPNPDIPVLIVKPNEVATLDFSTIDLSIFK